MDTRYKLIAGGHVNAVEPVAAMLLVRVVHGIFFRPSELAI